MSQAYHYAASGRQPKTLAIVSAVWAVLLAAVIWLDASLVVIGVLGAFTLPALYDWLADPQTSFALTSDHIAWQTPRQHAQIALTEIDHLRLDTRLDLSVRVTVMRPSGVSIRVPVSATPPHLEVEHHARTLGLKVVRHHFSLRS